MVKYKTYLMTVKVKKKRISVAIHACLISVNHSVITRERDALEFQVSQSLLTSQPSYYVSSAPSRIKRVVVPTYFTGVMWLTVMVVILAWLTLDCGCVRKFEARAKRGSTCSNRERVTSPSSNRCAGSVSWNRRSCVGIGV